MRLLSLLAAFLYALCCTRATRWPSHSCLIGAYTSSLDYMQRAWSNSCLAVRPPRSHSTAGAVCHHCSRSLRSTSRPRHRWLAPASKHRSPGRHTHPRRHSTVPHPGAKPHSHTYPYRQPLPRPPPCLYHPPKLSINCPSRHLKVSVLPLC
jgi:hypothetical protein